MVLFGSPQAFAELEHFGIDDGLSQNSVIAIARDPRGFLWIGTEDGLNRFDGVGFKVYRSEPGTPGLSDSFIQRLAIRGETLWIGTLGGGLARMDLRTERVESLADLDPPAPLSEGTVFALLPLADDTVLVGTQGGLFRLNWPVAARPTSVTEMPRPDGSDWASIRALATLDDGRIAVGSTGGLCLLAADASVCDAVELEPGGDPRVIEALAARDGRLWIGTRGSYQVLPVAPGRPHGSPRRLPVPAASGRIVSLDFDSDGSLWLGTDIGVFRHEIGTDRLSERIDPDPLEQGGARKVVYALQPDGPGRVWIGSWNGGLDLHDASRSGIRLYRPRLPEVPAALTRTVRAIATAPDRWWIGTYGYGVLEASLEDGQWRALARPPALAPVRALDELVWCLLQARDGTLWIGSDGGLSRWNPAQPDIPPRLIGDGEVRHVRALLEDRRGRIWIGGEMGLHVLGPDGNPRPVRTFGGGVLPDRRIFALHERPDGQILVGSWGGLHWVNPNLQVMLGEIAREAHLRRVWDIADDGAAGLWIVTSDGLVHLPAKGPMRRYTEGDGLGNRVVYGIESDSRGQLWLSTNRGLSRLDPVSGKVLQFGVGDGLQGAEFAFGSHARAPDGALLFGGTGGLNRIDPGQVDSPSPPPTAVLTAVLVDGHALDGGNRPAAPLLEHIRLAPGTSALEIHFAALGTDPARDLRFRYRLIGVDRDWQSVGARRFASYTEPPPGDYRFEVEAIGRHGQKSSAPRVLLVSVEPWWWETTGFRVLMAALILLLMISAVRWRLRDLERQREKLIDEVAARTTELAAQRDELARVNAELAALSIRDPLTGLVNRRELQRRLAEALEGTEAVVSVALFDLDHFKRINDTRGHAAGDQALRHFAGLLAPMLPPAATLGRHGGEEFLLILPGLDLHAASHRVESLLAALRRLPVADCEPLLWITASAGVATGRAGEGAEALTQRVDLALYRAKRSGRDRLALDPEPGASG